MRGADDGAAAQLEDGAAVLTGAVALARGADVELTAFELATFELADDDDAECEALADDTALDAALDTGATLDTAVAPSSDDPQADAPSVTASADPATAPARRHDAPRPNPASPFMGSPPSSRPSMLDGRSSWGRASGLIATMTHAGPRRFRIHAARPATSTPPLTAVQLIVIN